MGEATPDDTTLVVFRKRLGQERLERFFSRINGQAKGLLVGRDKILDASHVIADVAISSMVGLLRQVRLFGSEDYHLKRRDENPQGKGALKIQSMIERRFWGGKKWMGLRRARYRRKWRVAIQALMTFWVMNVKRMVKLLRGKEQEMGLLETG